MVSKRIITYFTIALLASVGCKQSNTVINENHKSNETTFEQVVFDVLQAYNNQDEKKINKFINQKYKIAVLFRRGASDNIGFSDSIQFSQPIPEYLPYDYGKATYDGTINYEKLPEFDCDKDQWNKPVGIYCDTITIDPSRSQIAKNEKKYEINDWPDSTIKQIEETEKSSRKVIVVGKDGGTFIFFLTKENKQWYLTGIDRFEACSA